MCHTFRALPQIMKIKRHTEELNGFLQQEKANNDTTYLSLTITQLCRKAVRTCTSTKVKIRCVYGTEIQTAAILSTLRMTEWSCFLSHSFGTRDEMRKQNSSSVSFVVMIQTHNAQYILSTYTSFSSLAVLYSQFNCLHRHIPLFLIFN
jgi:hypothetical protein